MQLEPEAVLAEADVDYAWAGDSLFDSVGEEVDYLLDDLSDAEEDLLKEWLVLYAEGGMQT